MQGNEECRGNQCNCDDDHSWTGGDEDGVLIWWEAQRGKVIGGSKLTCPSGVPHLTITEALLVAEALRSGGASGKSGNVVSLAHSLHAPAP